VNISKFKQILDTNIETVLMTDVIVNFVVALIIALFIFIIYKKTFSGVSYSKSFNITLVLVTLVTSMVIMVIGSNLALSLGMVGALSIIRFRSAIKDPKDSGYLFWGIAVGLATGTGIHLIAIIGSAIIAIVLILLNINVFNDRTYLLVIKGDSFKEDDVYKVIKDCTKRNKLKMKNTAIGQKELVFEVFLKNNEEETITNMLSYIEHIYSVNIVAYNGEISD
jgi:uncharacterized membrane protein YhiD involved in acid resistance